MKYDADVGVLGMGAMGSMTAWQLAKRGASVIGFDRLAPGHDQSASGGESRIFRTAYKEGPKYVPLLKRSHMLWRELEADTGKSLLHLNGGLSIGKRDSASMNNIVQSAETYGIDHELLEAREVKARYPIHSLEQDEIAFLDKEAGYIRPERAIVAAARHAAARGAHIHSYTTIKDIEFDDDGVRLYSETGEWHVRKLVVSAGPWTRKLLPLTADGHKLVRIVLAWYQTTNDAMFHPDRFPIFIREAGGVDFCGWPMINGNSVKIGRNGSHGIFEDADLLDRNVEPGWFVQWRRVIRRYLPDIIPDPVRVSAFMDSWTPTKDPVIALHPECAHVVMMYGFSGHGFKLSPAFGEIAANLALETASGFDLAPFAYKRTAPIDEFPTQSLMQ